MAGSFTRKVESLELVILRTQQQRNDLFIFGAIWACDSPKKILGIKAKEVAMNGEIFVISVEGTLLASYGMPTKLDFARYFWKYYLYGEKIAS
ncbi:MAG: hypothetical protein BWZ03_00738 [bacterium ADurb.BinA186]|nr:MAG: hypothetical protein BWZ03_00738 [bacterium ADurb.BinA186]